MIVIRNYDVEIFMTDISHLMNQERGIRIWAVETILSNCPVQVIASQVIEAAAALEQYVLAGHPTPAVDADFEEVE